MIKRLKAWAMDKYEESVYWNKIHDNFPQTTSKVPDWWIAMLKWLSK